MLEESFQPSPSDVGLNYLSDKNFSTRVLYFKSNFQASILILRTFFMYNFYFMVQWDYSLPGFRHDALQVVICWPRTMPSVSLFIYSNEFSRILCYLHCPKRWP